RHRAAHASVRQFKREAEWMVPSNELAGAAVILLAPYARVLAEGASKKVGEQIVGHGGEAARRLYDVIRHKLSSEPETQHQLDEFATAPEEATTQRALC